MHPGLSPESSILIVNSALSVSKVPYQSLPYTGWQVSKSFWLFTHIICSTFSPTCHTPNNPIRMTLNLTTIWIAYWCLSNSQSFSPAKGYAPLPLRLFPISSAKIYSFLPRGLACLLVNLFPDILWFLLLTYISFFLLPSLIDYCWVC